MIFRPLTSTLVIALLAAPSFAQTRPRPDDHSAHAAQTPAAPAPAGQAPAPQAPPFARPANDKVPPGIAEAGEELKTSKLKNEWVSIPYGEGPTIKAFVVYPERREKAPVVIVIHEIFGLTEWIRGVAEQLVAIVEVEAHLPPDAKRGAGADV